MDQFTALAQNYFKFEDEFNGPLEFFPYDTTLYRDEENLIQWTIGFNPEYEGSTDTEHLDFGATRSDNKIITGEDVLFATISFKMKDDEFDMSGFQLVSDEENSPETGITIAKSVGELYTDADYFRFTDATASKDANLTNLIVSSGSVDEEDPTNTTYKEYTLTPTFENGEADQDGFIDYNMELLEYIDEVDIKAILSDEKASIKMNVPKRVEDEDGNLTLVWDGSDETSIEYVDVEPTRDEENKTNISSKVVLNKLGEPDTIITIIVTAEDEKTENKYRVTIHRPYGIIKGKIQIPATKSGSKKCISDIRIYNCEDVTNAVGGEIIPAPRQLGDDIHEKLIALNSKDEVTNDDGSFQIKVIPGSYDVLFDKVKFLDYIFRFVVVEENKETDLNEDGDIILIAGDLTDKTGNSQGKSGMCISQDAVYFKKYFNGRANGTIDAIDNELLYYDFNEDGRITSTDYTFVKPNVGKFKRTVVYKNNN